MSRHYYAMYQYVPEEVAIFNSRKERDAWVNCSDPISIAFPPIDTDRVPLTQIEAVSLIGCGRLYAQSNYIEDLLNDNVMWVIAKRM